jgi:Arc/MetJ-type ribon-helix-helix transcriptional regulator
MVSSAKVRISEDIDEALRSFVNTSEYKSKREFVDDAIQEKMEREEDALSVEERVDRIEERLDELT